MLIVRHLGISQSERIIWLCEELEIPYQLIRYDRDPETRLAPKEYKALHPFETAPVIIDDDLVLAESGAIIEYIISKYGDGRFTLKANNPNFADYLFWYHFANGSMMPAMSIDLVVKWIGGETRDAHPAIKSLRQRVDRAFDLVEKRLGTVDYFAGSEFTAADIMMLFPLTTMRVFTPLDLTPYPNIRAELEPVGKWYTGPVRPVEKCYRSGPAGNGPVGIICPTGEIPAKTGEIPVKTGEKVTIFLENNFFTEK